MKRLFCVKNTNTKHKLYPLSDKAAGEVQFYTDDKMFAKGMRDALGGVDKGFHVSHGPDHMGKHGNRLSRMRLQPKPE
ncbi:MAG: hypothetical protein GWO28_10485 [candidate division Zixibacteria bacterium]|nr:hypothetical protein [candidate division Zixibacteria bacterium]